MTAAAVKTLLIANAKPARAAALARFFKTGPGDYAEGDLFLGLTVPEQRDIARQFAQLALDETEQLVRDPYHECRLTGLIIWTNQFKKAGPTAREAIVERYIANLHYINNWDLVDVTCPTVLGNYLLYRDRSLLYNLAAQDHLWSQRIAVITTLAFIRKGQFSDTFALTEQLLTHRHDLMHKAMGWMLREVGKRSPEALDEFLHDHIRQFPRTTLRYAIEKFTPARRRYYLDL